MQASNEKHKDKGKNPEDESVSTKIFTIPNFISLIRLCLVPVFFILLYDGYDIWATLLFALAAGTDWIDGQVARRTNSVSKLGQILDPAVDRVLLFSGVLGLLMIGRLPLWIVLVVVIRDAIMLFGGFALLSRYKIRIPVIYAGKAATACLLTGFAGLLLNWPLIPGLGLIDIAWLPGFNADPVSWGIWFVYIGLVLSVVTGVYYLYTAYRKLRTEKAMANRSST